MAEISTLRSASLRALIVQAPGVGTREHAGGAASASRTLPAVWILGWSEPREREGRCRPRTFVRALSQRQRDRGRPNSSRERRRRAATLTAACQRQIHLTSHKIAPRLVRRFSLIAPVLRGCGNSAKPEDGEGHVNDNKCVRAGDQIDHPGVMGRVALGAKSCTGCAGLRRIAS